MRKLDSVKEAVEWDRDHSLLLLHRIFIRKSVNTNKVYDYILKFPGQTRRQLVYKFQLCDIDHIDSDNACISVTPVDKTKDVGSGPGRQYLIELEYDN